MLQEAHHLAWPESFEGSPSCLCDSGSLRLHGNQTALVEKVNPSKERKRERHEMKHSKYMMLFGFTLALSDCRKQDWLQIK